MTVCLKKVTSTERQILWNLLQYMIFETSPYGNNEINSDGTFNYKYFDKYFTDDDREAYLIKSDYGELLGFVMINQYLQESESGHAIAEFMILPRFRRHGIGRKVAKQCFSLFPGNWEVQPAPGSESAYKFWKSVIDDITREDSQMVDGIFVFCSRAEQSLSSELFATDEERAKREVPVTTGDDEAGSENRFVQFNDNKENIHV